MGQSYQSAAIEGTTKAFLLEEKRSRFDKYESKSKPIQKQNLFYQFSFTRQMYGSRIGQIAEN